LVAAAGPLKGLQVLDAGCGWGDLTLYLLVRGAVVTALDVSPGMIGVVQRRAERLPMAAQARLRVVSAPLEETGLPSDSFDLVLGRMILHHIDTCSGARELDRLMRPGGRAVFIENTGNNPLLMFARNHLAGRMGIPRFGTVDEHPLTASDIDAFRDVFATVRAHYPVFEFFGLLDRQLLQFKHPRVSRLMRALDEAVYRFAPGLRKFSYRVLVECQTAAKPWGDTLPAAGRREIQQT
jgi:ubiquinone/menaquinone biosynthesis C-methylase UbiE